VRNKWCYDIGGPGIETDHSFCNNILNPEEDIEVLRALEYVEIGVENSRTEIPFPG
jgi:hypothetical protein